MKFILSHHAEEKIIQLQISWKILQDILNNPEQILEEDEIEYSLADAQEIYGSSGLGMVR